MGSPAEQVVQAEVADEVQGVHSPNKCIEAREGFTDSHVADQLGGVDPELGVVEDSDGYEDGGYHGYESQGDIHASYSWAHAIGIVSAILAALQGGVGVKDERPESHLEVLSCWRSA